ncbi:hypothetical protein CIK63_08815 [Brevibacterium aurantiacum]|nr:hypothetical protein CIK63_08815 [Brevibacterium aurantiacum]
MAGDRAGVADVEGQGIRGEIGGENVSVVPATVLKTREVRDLEARCDPLRLGGAEDRLVFAQILIAGRGSARRHRGGQESARAYRPRSEESSDHCENENE